MAYPAPAYMPVMNRAGWYKSFFMDVVADPSYLDKMVGSFAWDTYRPGITHPDLNKRDKSCDKMPLAERALQVGGLWNRVCQETAVAMQAEKGAQAAADQAAAAVQSQQAFQADAQRASASQTPAVALTHTQQTFQQNTQQNFYPNAQQGFPPNAQQPSQTNAQPNLQPNTQPTFQPNGQRAFAPQGPTSVGVLQAPGKGSTKSAKSLMSAATKKKLLTGVGLGSQPESQKA